MIGSVHGSVPFFFVSSARLKLGQVKTKNKNSRHASDVLKSEFSLQNEPKHKPRHNETYESLHLRVFYFFLYFIILKPNWVCVCMSVFVVLVLDVSLSQTDVNF